MHDLFDILDRDWQQLLARPATRDHYRAWARHDCVLAPYADLGQVIAAAHRRDDQQRSDQLLGALAARSPADTLAARALLHALSPGLRSLAFRHRWLAPADELTA